MESKRARAFPKIRTSPTKASHLARLGPAGQRAEHAERSAAARHRDGRAAGTTIAITARARPVGAGARGRPFSSGRAQRAAASSRAGTEPARDREGTPCRRLARRLLERDHVECRARDDDRLGRRRARDLAHNEIIFSGFTNCGSDD